MDRLWFDHNRNIGEEGQREASTRLQRPLVLCLEVGRNVGKLAGNAKGKISYSCWSVRDGRGMP